MRTDRELIELAAKAAGYKSWLHEDGIFLVSHEIEEHGDDDVAYAIWNPLGDDGDALRLAVKLRISLIHEQEYAGGPVIETIEATGPRRADWSRHCEMLSLNDADDDEMANTRRAIILAAAEIGTSMP